MPNCPCENEASTCVDSSAPITRALDGECVKFGLAIANTSTASLAVNGSGQLTATPTLSGNAGQAIQALASGLYVASPTQTVAEDLICAADDCGDITPAASSLPNSCNGIEVRTCPGSCGGQDQTGLWAPPETRSKGFWAQDTGANTLDFVNGSYPGGYIPSGAGANVGGVTTDGYVFRSLPLTSGGGGAQKNLKYTVTNDWCTDAIFQVDVMGFGGKMRFEDASTKWVIDVFGRLYTETSGGASLIYTSGAARVFSELSVQDETSINYGDIGFTVPGITSRPVRVLAGDFMRLRAEVVFYIRQSAGGGGVILSSFAGLREELRVSGTLVASHKHTTTDFTGI